MHATYIFNEDHKYENNQTPRKALLYYSSSTLRENSAQVLATATNSHSERIKFLPDQNKIKPEW